MDRNPYFWGPEPTVDRVDYRVYTNQEAMIQALKNNEIDIADGLKPSLINSVSNIPNITVQKVVSDWWLNLAFNFGGQNDRRAPVAGAARSDRPQGDRDGDRQERDRQQGVPRGGDAGRHDRSAGLGVLASRHPGRSGVPVRPGGGQRDAGRRRLRGYERRRCSGGPGDRRAARDADAGLLRHHRRGRGGRADRGLSEADRHQGRPAARHRHEDERLLGLGRLRRLHLVLERRPRPELSAVRVHLGTVRLLERRLLEGPAFRSALRGTAQHDGPDAAADRSCSRRSSTSTTRCRASCWPIPIGSRPTGTTSSPGGSRPRARRDTCCATYNYDTLLAVKPVAGSSTAARRRCRAGSGSSPVVAVVGIVVARGPSRTPHRARRSLRESNAWGHGGTCSARRCRPS